MADDQQQTVYKPTDGRRVQGKIQFPAQPSKKALDKLTGRHPELDNRPSQWSARVDKVKRCGSKEYNSGQGYKTEFEYSEDEEDKRCILTAEGGHAGLNLALLVASQARDPSPRVLFRFNIPDEKNLVSIRLFDQSRSMDVHLDPKPKGKFAAKARAEADYWSISFSAGDEREIRNTKQMLRRVENVTLGMPDVWFKYRNYFTRTPNVGDEANESQQSSQPSIKVGENLVDLGGGYNIRFTGCLASLEWLSLEGHKNIRPARSPIREEAEGDTEERDPDAAVTRAQAGKVGPSFGHTSLLYRTEPGKGTKRQKQAAKRAKKLNRRQAQREERLAARQMDVEDAEEGDWSAAAAAQLEWENRAVAEKTAAETASPAGDQAGDLATSESEADGRSYEIKGLLDHRIDENGVTQYLVDWKPIDGEEFDPTWEPESLVDRTAIDAYEFYRARLIPRTGRRGRGRPRGRGRA